MSKELIERLKQRIQIRRGMNGGRIDANTKGMQESIAAIEEFAAERDALAAELKTLREQKPVAWGDEPWMASFGVRVGRDSSNSIDLIFTTVWQRKFQLYAHEAAYLRWLLNKAEIPGYPNTHPVPARELTDETIQRHWDEACKDTPQTPGWSRHIRFARAIERYLKGEGE